MSHVSTCHVTRLNESCRTTEMFDWDAGLGDDNDDFMGCFQVHLSDVIDGSVHTTLQHTATHCNTLKQAAAHCNTLQTTATHCNALQRTATHCNALQRTATHCNALQRTAAHCSTLQHTAAHCNTHRCLDGLDMIDGFSVCCSVLQCVAVRPTTVTHTLTQQTPPIATTSCKYMELVSGNIENDEITATDSLCRSRIYMCDMTHTYAT